jgi:hypothetical protein
MRARVVGLLVLAVLVLGLPASAAAQGTNCTTFFAHTSMPMTSCSTPAGTVQCTTFFADTNMPITNCDGAPALPQPVYSPHPVYSPPPVVVPAPAPVDEGLTIKLDSGGARYLQRGDFVKIGDAPAIYWVYGGRLHAFSTWPQFLSSGGSPNLSNVVLFTYLRDNGGLYGAPVPR